MRRLRLFVIGSMLYLVNATTAYSQAQFSAIHGASASKYDEWTTGLEKRKLRPTFVSVAELKGEPTYAAIAVANKLGQAWAIKRDLTADEYQKEFLAQNAKGLRPICVVGYRRGKAVNYAAIFLKDDNKAWMARHGMDAKLNQQSFDSLSRLGYRPVQGSAYETSDGVQFSYVFVKDEVRNWLSQSGLPADQFQKLIDDYAKKNVHPISVSGYATKNGTRFAAIVVEDARNRTWTTKYHLTPRQYQAYYDEMTGKGFRPTQIRVPVERRDSLSGGVRKGRLVGQRSCKQPKNYSDSREVLSWPTGILLRTKYS